MPKVLITGVAGLIGSHFAKYLLDKGYEVYGVDNLSGGYREFVPEGVHFEEGSLLEKSALWCRTWKPDYVYHFAAYAAEGLSPFIRKHNYTNNLLTSAVLTSECINYGVKKIIFTSSMAVYGNQKPPFREVFTPRPIDPYGIAKYAVEMDLRQAYKQFGLDYSVVRPHNVIGTNQNIWDRYRNVIGIWIRKAIDGEDITVFGDGKQTRAFSDIQYYMEPLEKLMTSFSGETFNLGSDNHISIGTAAKVVQSVAKRHGFNPNIINLESRHEAKNAFCSHAKAKKLLDFKDETDFPATVEKMFVWAMSQPKREVKEMSYEIKKGMYEYWK